MSNKSSLQSLADKLTAARPVADEAELKRACTGLMKAESQKEKDKK